MRNESVRRKPDTFIPHSKKDGRTAQLSDPTQYRKGIMKKSNIKKPTAQKAGNLVRVTRAMRTVTPALQRVWKLGVWVPQSAALPLVGAQHLEKQKMMNEKVYA